MNAANADLGGYGEHFKRGVTIMKVHLKQIPAEGIHLEGTEEADILELEENQVRPVGPIEYSLDIGVSESGLFVTGNLGVDVGLECVSCLKRFIFPIRVPRLCGSNRADRARIGRLDAVDSRGYPPRSSSSSALRLGPKDVSVSGRG